MSHRNSKETEPYRELLNPSLWTRIREFWEAVMTTDNWSHPINDELIIQVMEEEIKTAEKRLRETDGWANLPEREKGLRMLNAQILACETAIEESARLRLRFALRYALKARAYFQMSRDAVTTERL
jgi:hypothetical protein